MRSKKQKLPLEIGKSSGRAEGDWKGFGGMKFKPATRCASLAEWREKAGAMIHGQNGGNIAK